MSTAQPGIFAQGTRSHLYLEFDLVPGADPEVVLEALQALREPPVTAGGANLVVAMGDRLWRQLSPDAAPERLRPFDPIDGTDGFTAPATQHDVWIWVHGTSEDVVVDIGRAAVVALAPAAILVSDLAAFVYQDSRDFFGFVDGTENPPIWEAHLSALVSPGGVGAGGSHVLVMKWHHAMGKFHAQPEADQERVIGRTKPDSVELDDDVRPDDAHISRVVIEDDEGEEREIWRRSTPWGNVSEQGLNFVGFSGDPEIFDLMLARMFGTSGDGVHDRILEFSKPVGGAFYFAPSLDDLYEVFAKR